MADLSFEEMLELFKDTRPAISNFGWKMIIESHKSKKDVEGLCNFLALSKMINNPELIEKAKIIFYNVDQLKKWAFSFTPEEHVKWRLESMLEDVFKALAALGARETIPLILDAGKTGGLLTQAKRAVRAIIKNSAPLQPIEGKANLFAAFPERPGQPLQLIFGPK